LGEANKQAVELPSPNCTISFVLEEAKMANVFVEARPKGKPAGSPITDYIVEDRADHVLGSFRTQEAATHWARIHGHSPHVARVRHLNDKDKPDHWRKV
jgi:hypothetical protein